MFIIPLNNLTGARPRVRRMVVQCDSVVLTHITLKRVLVPLAPPGGLPSASLISSDGHLPHITARPVDHFANSFSRELGPGIFTESRKERNKEEEKD